MLAEAFETAVTPTFPTLLEDFIGYGIIVIFLVGFLDELLLQFPEASIDDLRRQGQSPMPIHVQYGFGLPEIPAVRLEENIAEKFARLNRTATARELY